MAFVKLLLGFIGGIILVLGAYLIILSIGVIPLPEFLWYFVFQNPILNNKVFFFIAGLLIALASYFVIRVASD